MMKTCFALPLLMGALTAQAAAPDYEQPRVLTGTVFETTSGTNKILFTFKRTAVRSNDSVHVLRDFNYPNGSLAARETAVFKDAQLISFELDERQTGAVGKSRIGNGQLSFVWTEKGASRTDSEKLKGEALVSDMIAYFIVANWTEIARGQEVEFRFIVPSRLETVGFKFVKDSEVVWRGKPALRIRMEPSSFVIRQIVDPLYFTVEKDGEHRVLEYVGRTTPKQRDGAKWKDLDARTVYDW